MNGLMKIEAEQDLGRPPVLFVHGAWHGAWCWRPLMEHFAAAGIHVLRPRPARTRRTAR